MSRRALTICVALSAGCGSSPRPPPVLESRVPATVPDAGVIDAAPSSVVGPIIATQPNGSDVLLTIGKGLLDGVDTYWTGVVVDSFGVAVAGEDVVIIRIDKQQTIGILRGRAWPSGTLVRLSPPQ